MRQSKIFPNRASEPATQNPLNNPTPQNTWEWSCLAGTLFLYTLSRLWMYFRFGARAFGYDTGIYRHDIIGYFARLGDTTLQPFGFTALSNMLTLMGARVDTILFAAYIALAILTALALYVVVARFFNRHVALLALAIFSLSIIQFEFFWWYYYRNLIGLFAILVACLLYQQRSYLLILPLFLLGVIHPLSLIPIALTFLILFFISPRERSYLWRVGLTSGLLTLILNWYELRVYLPFFTEKFGLVKNIAPLEQNEISGQFVDHIFFLKMTAPYIPLAAIGLWQWAKKTKLFVIFLLINIFLILIKIVFYRRFFVFIDIALIMYAGAGLYCLLQKITARWFIIALLTVLFASGAGYTTHYIVKKQPLISEIDFLEIISLNALPPNSYLMTISPYYAPWVYGFTNHRIIAPGMFEHNLWNRDTWNIFWYTPNQNERDVLLAQYKEPIYIYTGSLFTQFGQAITHDRHIKRMGPFLWRFDL